MKVLMFGWEFPPHISGGLGTACHGLTKGLQAVGDVEIVFVVPKAHGDEDQEMVRLLGANEISLGPKIYNYRSFLKKISFIEVHSNIVPYASPEEYENIVATYKHKKKLFVKTHLGGKLNFTGEYGTNLFQEITNYAVIAGKIAQLFDFDVIHAHDWLTYPAGMAAKEISGKPLIVHVHATEFDRSGGHVNQDVYDLERKGMHYADRIITVSNFTKDTVISNYGIEPNKVQTVYNAVDSNMFREKLKAQKGLPDKIVTFLGRVTMQKGPEYFIEAANRVLQKMSNVTFVMAGSGEMLERMINRVAELGIGNKFHFTGFLKGDEVHELFQMSDLYVMPSVSEPFGISPLEAMHSNVPVIISKQSGVSEILNNAIKIDFWDIDAMADAIYGTLNYKGLTDHLKAHSKAEVDNIKWEVPASRIKEIYKELI